MVIGEVGLEFSFLYCVSGFGAKVIKASWVWSVPSLFSTAEDQDDLFLQSLIKLVFKVSGLTAGFLWVYFKYWIQYWF